MTRNMFELTSGYQRCPHECRCDCHTRGGMHVVACCAGRCNLCDRHIMFGMMYVHQKVCHGPPLLSEQPVIECEHRCRCECHEPGYEKGECGGVGPCGCCIPCPFCGQRIDVLLKEAHLKKCHKTNGEDEGVEPS